MPSPRASFASRLRHRVGRGSRDGRSIPAERSASAFGVGLPSAAELRSFSTPRAFANLACFRNHALKRSLDQVEPSTHPIPRAKSPESHVRRELLIQQHICLRRVVQAKVYAEHARRRVSIGSNRKLVKRPNQDSLLKLNSLNRYSCMSNMSSSGSCTSPVADSSDFTQSISPIAESIRSRMPLSSERRSFNHLNPA